MILKETFGAEDAVSASIFSDIAYKVDRLYAKAQWLQRVPIEHGFPVIHRAGDSIVTHKSGLPGRHEN